MIPIAYGTSWRLQTYETALEAAQKARSFAGISRISKISPLAGLNVPVFSVSRPESKVSVTVCSGKGTSELESRLSGLYEAIEIACAEKTIPSIVATAHDLVESGKRIFPLTTFGIAESEDEIRWSEATEYQSGDSFWIPSSAISLLPCSKPFLPDSNGLASGSSFEEALFHGLLEVLERHAYSLALIYRRGVSVNLENIDDSFLEEALSSLSSMELSCEVKDISEWTGVPTYYCLIFSKQEQDSHLINGGLGTHLDPVIALRRAVTEAFQSRAIAVAGAREDMADKTRIHGHRIMSKYHLFRFWLEPTAERATVPGSVLPIPFGQAINDALSTARKYSPELGRLLYYRYSSPENISVVRAILEGSECFAFNRKRMGTRIRQIYQSVEAKYGVSTS